MNKTKDEIIQVHLRELTTPTDINEHLPVLKLFGVDCPRIVEFGVRGGCSTRAFYAGQILSQLQTHLDSYDIRDCASNFPGIEKLGQGTNQFRLHVADTANLEVIPHCDLLFLDTLHTRDQVTFELRHHLRVSKYIVFHDTVLFGENGEQGQPGINHAIRQFLQHRPEWVRHYEYQHNCGLLILKKIKA